jgi:hypothetical protein
MATSWATSPSQNTTASSAPSLRQYKITPSQKPSQAIQPFQSRPTLALPPWDRPSCLVTDKTLGLHKMDNLYQFYVTNKEITKGLTHPKHFKKNFHYQQFSPTTILLMKRGIDPEKVEYFLVSYNLLNIGTGSSSMFLFTKSTMKFWREASLLSWRHFFLYIELLYLFEWIPMQQFVEL